MLTKQQYPTPHNGYLEVDMAKYVTVTIRMPEEWFDSFWSCYLNSGSNEVFQNYIDTVGHEVEVERFTDWHKASRTIVHAKSAADLKRCGPGIERGL